jgi:hypothetical protein
MHQRRPLDCERKSRALKVSDREASHEAIDSTLMLLNTHLVNKFWSLEEMD